MIVLCFKSSLLRASRLPHTQCLHGKFFCEQEKKRDDVKEWVLAVSMDQKIDQVLDQDDRGTFVGSLVCKQTKQRYEACIVSGYPVLTSVKYGSRMANKPDWNKFLMASMSAHSENMRDVLRFLRQWCGASEEPAYAFQ